MGQFSLRQYSYPLWKKTVWYVSFNGHQLTGPFFFISDAQKSMEEFSKQWNAPK